MRYKNVHAKTRSNPRHPLRPCGHLGWHGSDSQLQKGEEQPGVGLDAEQVHRAREGQRPEDVAQRQDVAQPLGGVQRGDVAATDEGGCDRYGHRARQRDVGHGQQQTGDVGVHADAERRENGERPGEAHLHVHRGHGVAHRGSRTHHRLAAATLEGERHTANGVSGDREHIYQVPYLGYLRLIPTIRQ